MTIAEIMLPEFDREMARTRRILAAVPADKMSWQAHNSLHTICWNANHLVDILTWTPQIIGESEFDMAPVNGPKYETPSIEDPATLLQDFDQNVSTAREAITGVSDEALAEPWTLKSGGQPLFTISKGECLRTWVLNHMVHHRAILSVLLRMAGVEVTPAYDG